MVGDQITIFLSYPAEDPVNKKRFLDFDQKLKEISEWIYQLSSQESGLLRLLRMLGFRGYRPLIRNAQKRNRIERGN